MTRLLSRRAFLKLSGAASVAVQWPARRGLRLASTWPLSYPHHYFPNPETLLAYGLNQFDLLLLPAYAAAELIQTNALQTMPGLPGRASAGSRAHDPDGAFTLPYLYQTITLPLASTWPNHPRVVIGAALWARGYSPNDSHPGHLAQVEQDLLVRRPPKRSDPAMLVVEFDWVIPRAALKATAACEFLASLRPLTPGPRAAVPLMPASPAARAQISQIWERLIARQSA